jgi:hypothetical protein
MGNILTNGPKNLKLIVRVRISYINVNLEKKLLIWKLDFKAKQNNRHVLSKYISLYRVTYIGHLNIKGHQ